MLSHAKLHNLSHENNGNISNILKSPNISEDTIGKDSNMHVISLICGRFFTFTNNKNMLLFFLFHHHPMTTTFC